MAGKLGYCALDRRRAALSGEEIRGCWEGVPADNRPPDSAPWASRVIDPSAGGRRSRVDFVPVDEVRAKDEPGSPPGRAIAADEGATFRYQLWDDPEG